MSVLTSFLQHCQQQFPFIQKGNSRLLLAVSGGLDSTVLVDLVDKAGFPFAIAHMNFGLRGEESLRDEAFVQSLGERYKADVFCKRVDTGAYAAIQKLSIQEAARELRYHWFAGIINNWHRDTPALKTYIAIAHHADDNIETAVMHFFRGTGIQGLTGIPAFQPDRSIVRPLLVFRKEELRKYANEAGLPYVEDSSNASDKYTRNFFRNRLLPQIKDIYPQAEHNIISTLQRLSDAAQVYQHAVVQRLQKLMEHRNGEVHIPVLKWKKETPLSAITWEIIKPYGFTSAQADEVIRLLDAGNGAYISSATHRIIRNRNWMIITTPASASTENILIEKTDTTTVFGGGSLHFSLLKKKPADIASSPMEVFIDASSISYPLLLRKWKQGDYFYPLGMTKKKKLSRFFIDQKLSRTQKEKVWVLETDKKIIWVIGYRIDNRFRITDTTRTILQITAGTH